MAVDLTRSADQVDFDDAAYTPLLNHLQANILRPHGRDFTRNIFLRFVGGREAVRNWIVTQVAGRVTSAKEQLDQIGARRDSPPGQPFDGGPVYCFFLTAAGYAYLGFDKGAFPGKAFAKGMKDRSDYKAKKKAFGIFAIKEPNRDPPPQAWEPGFRGDIHALLIIGDDGAIAPETGVRDETRLLNLLEEMKGSFGAAVQSVAIDSGRVLRRTFPNNDKPEPIEHFGYFDGISQPLFSVDDLAEYQRKFHRPLASGEWDPGASLDLVLERDPFASATDAFGSFFVYRKLAQDVAAFHEREEALEDDIPLPEEQGGAMTVGRFENGTPLALHATDSPQPTPGTGADFIVDNCFTYKSDPKGFKCPVHAHIRKVNPRGTTPGHTDAEERARRIARRGIPYGRPTADNAAAGVQTGGPDEERGLLFMCYQASIDEQFEFIQRIWVDNRGFPEKEILTFGENSGDDPLIGQHVGPRQRWPRQWGNSGAGKKKYAMEAAVTLMGGEYFFAPSRPFLKGL